MFLILLVMFQPTKANLVAAQQHPPTEFLGFQSGEERRYVLGPAEALNPDEWANWSIRLESVTGDPPVGTFSLAHERNDPEHNRDLSQLPRGSNSRFSLRLWTGLRPDFRDAVHVRLTGEVKLNQRGFPLEISFAGVQRFASRVHELSVLYTSVGDTYLKNVVSNGRQWSVMIPVGADIRLKTDPLAGLYAWFPTDMHCLGRGSVRQYVADLSAMTEPCDTPVLLFANPGLLELALSTPWESGAGVRHMWFLTPTGPLSNAPFAPAGFGPGTLARDESQYYRKEGFEYLGRTTVEVGDQRLSATEVAVEGALGSVYLDQQGRVVRVDLGPHPITSRPRWIRLLSRSEYEE